jgi:hypothetical protein
MEEKLILNKVNKEFVYVGYFYGHIEENKVIVQDSSIQVCFDIESVIITLGEYEPTTDLIKLKYYVRFFTIDNMDPDIDMYFDKPGLYVYNNDFSPDLVFQSTTSLKEFYNFIKLCQDI